MKYLKLLLITFLSFVTIYIGHIFYNINKTMEVTHIMWWISFIIPGLLIFLPLYDVYAKLYFKWIFKIKQTTFDKNDVKEIIIDLMDKVHQKEINNGDDFKKWLKSKGL